MPAIKGITLWHIRSILLLLTCLSRVVFAHEEFRSLELPHSKEHSLLKPFHVMGTTTPYWDIFGSTMVTPDYIRLTSDQQSRSGGIRNQLPVKSDWEVHLHFKIHGKSTTLFGDGMAFWYLTEQLKPGPVFGASDRFSGLVVMVDTYKNHKEHHRSKNSYPRIAVMVNNGSLTYNHDRDGIPAVVGWCEAQVRKVRFETHVSIRYENNQLLVQTDIEGSRKWKQCVHLKRLNLPRSGFFGLSSSTGDLSDNHDVLSFKTYLLDSEPDQDRRAFVPAVSYEDGPMKKVSEADQDASPWRIFFLLFFVLLGSIFIISILYLYWQDRKENILARQKRLS